MEGDNLISDCENSIKKIRQGIESDRACGGGSFRLGGLGKFLSLRKIWEKSISAKAQNCFGSSHSKYLCLFETNFNQSLLHVHIPFRCSQNQVQLLNETCTPFPPHTPPIPTLNRSPIPLASSVPWIRQASCHRSFAQSVPTTLNALPYPLSLLLLLSHFSRVRLCVTPSLGFSRQEHWSGLLFPSPMHKSESEVTQSCLTLRNPCTAAYQAPPSMWFSRQEYWSGVPLPSPTLFL